ncbi:hypothetical protein BHS30_16885 [Klebsiella pneumoniae]|nr:hypothetical protein BHS30_16885 [Klebsiella pneumoniae]
MRLNRNRQPPASGQHPGMILLGVLRSVQQRQQSGAPGAGANAQGVSTQCKLPSGETLDEWALWRRIDPAKS